MQVPDLLSRYNFFLHAMLGGVEIGPRQELILWVHPFEWGASGGNWIDEQRRVRFGGIINYEAVKTFFSNIPEEELTWIRLDDNQSKPNSLFYKVAFERTGIICLIHCQNVSVDNNSSFDMRVD